MAISHWISQYESFNRDLMRSITEDDYPRVQHLDKQISEALEYLFNVRPTNSDDRDVLFRFFLRLLNPNLDRGGLTERVENKLIDLCKY